MGVKRWNGSVAWTLVAGATGIWVLGAGQGAEAAAPRVSQLAPHPGDWVVDDSSLTQVVLTFDSDVTIPVGAITGRTIGGGSVTVTVDAVPGTPTQNVTVTFDSVFADRLTLVVDYTIENAAGEALDGEVGQPLNPTLPTGDSAQGGQVVLQFTVLQGDVSRDGFVNSDDSLLMIAAMESEPGDPNWNPDADLNRDGVVDDADALILSDALAQGLLLPVTDGTPPTVVFTSTDSLPLPFDEFVVKFDGPVDPDTVTRSTVYAVGMNGMLVTASDEPTTVDNQEFVFSFDQLTCLQQYGFTVSNSVGDASGELLEFQTPVTLVGIDDVDPVIACPDVAYVNSTRTDGIWAQDAGGVAELAAFLNGATATDACGVTITTSLDTPVDLPLGVTFVTFTATDEAENWDDCDAPLVVVPAVAVFCWDLDQDGDADPDEDANGDGVVDVLDCQGEDGADGADGGDGADGADGEDGANGANGANGQDGGQGPAGSDGADGLNCWDLNGNGTKDLATEDLNEDGVVSFEDCQGEDGQGGADGQDGADGAGGADGRAGAAGQDGSNGQDGATGLNCWDLNRDGERDLDTEDVNADGVVNVLDCRGPQGEQGDPEPAIEVPESVDTPSTPQRRLCGVLGLLYLLCTLAGLSAMRLMRRRRASK